MPDYYDPVLEPLDPDPAAVERIIEHALAPPESPKRPGKSVRLVVIGLVLVASVAAVLRLGTSDKLADGGLGNHGDVYLYRSTSGAWIHNGSPPQSPTFQIIWTGDSP